MIPNLGSRSANVRSLATTRVLDLERTVERIDSRSRRGAAGFTARRVVKAAHGFTVGQWVKLVGSTWSLAATSSTFAAKVVAVVQRVVDADTVDVVTSGPVQLPGQTFTAWDTYYLSTVAGTASTTAPIAPNVVRAVAVGHEDGWLEVYGQASQMAAAGGITTPVSIANGGTAKTTIAADRFWYASALDTLAEATITAFGRGLVACADAAAGRTQLGMALSVLSDVTITSVANLDFLRYNSGSSKWVNSSLGEIAYIAATGGVSQFLALDGGATALAPTIVVIAGADSRLMLSQTSNPIDFVLSGLPSAGTEKTARIRRVSASEVSFFDQGTSTTTAGDKVLKWKCSATPSSRGFDYLVPLTVMPGATVANYLSLNDGYAQWDAATSDTAGTPTHPYYQGAARLGNGSSAIPTRGGGTSAGMSIFGTYKTGSSSGSDGLIELGVAASAYGIRMTTALASCKIAITSADALELTAVGTMTMTAGTAVFTATTFTATSAAASFSTLTSATTITSTGGAYKVGSNQVVGARDTGWAAMTGSSDKATTYATGTVTLAQLAGRMMALQAALTTHGLIGA